MAKSEIIQNTGINPDQYNETLTGINPFVAGLQEQAKKAKLLLSSTLFEIALGKALTKMLSNIIRWGPKLYGQIVEDIIDGQALQDVKYLNVKVPNKEVKGRGKKIRFEDAPGEFGYFELKDDLFQPKKGEYYDMSVRIVTPGNETLLDALKKAYFNDYMKNLQTFTLLYPGQPLPIESQELYEMMAEVYGFDPDQVSMSTETSKRRQEATDILGAIQAMNPDNLDAQAAQSAESLPAPAQTPFNLPPNAPTNV